MAAVVEGGRVWVVVACEAVPLQEVVQPRLRGVNALISVYSRGKRLPWRLLMGVDECESV